jgi:uncharacterized protein
MYPSAYIDYLIHFHCDRDFFECHEELEEHWKQDRRGERKEYWVGLIQLAVALYHHRRSNFNGAYRMLSSSINIINSEKEAIIGLGLKFDDLIIIINNRLLEIANKETYTDINLPISDKKLLNRCLAAASEQGLSWGQHSTHDSSIIHKHTLRDRSDVIEERNKQKELRKK